MGEFEWRNGDRGDYISLNMYMTFLGIKKKIERTVST